MTIIDYLQDGPNNRDHNIMHTFEINDIRNNTTKKLN